MNIHVAWSERSWPERVAFVFAAAFIIVIGFFFLAVALVAGALLAAVIGARLWWQLRKLKKQASSDIVEAEYHVVEHTETHIALPPRTSRPPPR